MMQKVRGWLWAGLAFALVAWCVTAFAQCLVAYQSSDKAPGIAAVTMYDAVNTESAAKLIEQIQAANQEKTDKPILLYINTGGGSVLAGGQIIDAMEASRRPIYTVCLSFCASMGAYIFEHGAKRLVLSHSVIMLHEMSAGVEGDVGHMSSQMNILLRMSERYERETAALVGITPYAYHLHIVANWWLLSDEALANHLADSLFSPSEYPVR